MEIKPFCQRCSHYPEDHKQEPRPTSCKKEGCRCDEYEKAAAPMVSLTTDLDTFRAMLERAGIEHTATVSVLDGRVSTFVQPGPGGLQVRFNGDGRLAVMAWWHEDDLVNVGRGK